MFPLTVLIISCSAFLARLGQADNKNDLAGLAIEGMKYERYDVFIGCTYKPMTPEQEFCRTCRHKIDCAVECALQNATVLNCYGFVAWSYGNGTFKSCILSSEVTCKGAITPVTGGQDGEVVAFYTKKRIFRPDAYVETTPSPDFRVNLVRRNVPALLASYSKTRKVAIDAFDPTLCGNGPRRSMYDPFVSSPNARIVGGTAASPAEFPYQALIYFVYSNGTANPGLMCGGSVIDREWVLTAAHCMPPTYLDFPFKWAKVHLGRYHTYVADNYTTYTLYNDSIIPHVFFMHGSYYHYDYMLLRLRPPLTRYTTTIQPICLKDGPELNLDNKIVMTTGWGERYNPYPDYSYPDRLQRLPRRLLPDKECVVTINSPTEFDPNHMLCTANSGERDQCQGDSGGPWAVVDQPFGKKNGSRWTLVGLTSWGRDCGTAPGVGARLSEDIVAWIKERIIATYRADVRRKIFRAIPRKGGNKAMRTKKGARQNVTALSKAKGSRLQQNARNSVRH